MTCLALYFCHSRVFQVTINLVTNRLPHWHRPLMFELYWSCWKKKSAEADSAHSPAVVPLYWSIFAVLSWLSCLFLFCHWQCDFSDYVLIDGTVSSNMFALPGPIEPVCPCIARRHYSSDTVQLTLKQIHCLYITILNSHFLHCRPNMLIWFLTSSHSHNCHHNNVSTILIWFKMFSKCSLTAAALIDVQKWTSKNTSKKYI